MALTLGIGGTAAVFSIVNTTMLRPLPYKDAERLVRIVENVPPEETPSGVALRTAMMNEEMYLWWRRYTCNIRKVSFVSWLCPLLQSLASKHRFKPKKALEKGALVVAFLAHMGTAGMLKLQALW